MSQGNRAADGFRKGQAKAKSLLGIVLPPATPELKPEVTMSSREREVLQWGHFLRCRQPRLFALTTEFALQPIREGTSAFAVVMRGDEWGGAFEPKAEFPHVSLGTELHRNAEDVRQSTGLPQAGQVVKDD